MMWNTITEETKYKVMAETVMHMRSKGITDEMIIKLTEYPPELVYNTPKMNSDMQWYLARINGPVQDFYDIFFQICRKYNISWGKATEKEKALVEELTEVTYELQLVKANRTPLEQKTPTEFLAMPQTKHSVEANHAKNLFQKLDAYVNQIAAGSDWHTYLKITKEEASRMGLVAALDDCGYTSEDCIQILMTKRSISEEEARTTYERYHEPQENTADATQNT